MRMRGSADREKARHEAPGGHVDGVKVTVGAARAFSALQETLEYG